MRTTLGILAIAATAYVLTRQKNDRNRAAPAAFADNQAHGSNNAVREAGPNAMRDKTGRAWTPTDERSDGSFPASDPPGNY